MSALQGAIPCTCIATISMHWKGGTETGRQKSSHVTAEHGSTARESGEHEVLVNLVNLPALAGTVLKHRTQALSLGHPLSPGYLLSPHVPRGRLPRQQEKEAHPLHFKGMTLRCPHCFGSHPTSHTAT